MIMIIKENDCYFYHRRSTIQPITTEHWTQRKTTSRFSLLNSSINLSIAF